MNFYQEYSIRCKSCGKPLAHLDEPYHQYLAQGLSTKSALDELRLTRVCCRTAMMTPVTVTFDMEQRDMIEGRRGTASVIEPVVPPDIPVAVAPLPSYNRIGRPTRTGAVPPRATRPVPAVTVPKLTIDDLIVPTLPSVPVAPLPEPPYLAPTEVGMPVINRPRAGLGVVADTRAISRDLHLEIATGRTYLAR